MPPTKFEEAIAAAKAAHYEQPDILQLIDLVVAQNENIKNLQHSSLEVKSRLADMEKTVAEQGPILASVAHTRDEHTAQLKVIQDKPVKDDKRIDDLDKRVSVVEGAVGSKAYRRIENKDVKPDLVPEANKPFLPPIVPARPPFQRTEPFQPAS